VIVIARTAIATVIARTAIAAAIARTAIAIVIVAAAIVNSGYSIQLSRFQDIDLIQENY
jgi:hypothetical protein